MSSRGSEDTGLVKEERKVILTLVKKGLELDWRRSAEKTYAETVARVNEIRAAIDEVKDRRSVTIQEYSAEIWTSWRRPFRALEARAGSECRSR